MLRVRARARAALQKLMATARGCAFPNWHRRSRPPGHRRELRLDRLTEFFQNSALLNGSESGGGQFPARFFAPSGPGIAERSEEHTSELQSHHDLVCRLLLEK